MTVYINTRPASIHVYQPPSDLVVTSDRPLFSSQLFDTLRPILQQGPAPGPHARAHPVLAVQIAPDALQLTQRPTEDPNETIGASEKDPLPRLVVRDTIKRCSSKLLR